MNADAVLAQLAKAMKAHRSSHHSSVVRARQHREVRAAAAEQRLYNEQNVAQPDEAGMPAGMPVDGISDSLMGLGGEDG